MPTRRQEIMAVLAHAPSTVHQLATLMGVRVSLIVDDLEHIQKTLGHPLILEPARCRACGFVMKKRTRFTAPSHCPRCRSEDTTEPTLGLTSRRSGMP